MLQLREEFSLSCLQQEMVVSTLLLGALLASFTGGQYVLLLKDKQHCFEL